MRPGANAGINSPVTRSNAWISGASMRPGANAGINRPTTSTRTIDIYVPSCERSPTPHLLPAQRSN